MKLQWIMKLDKLNSDTAVLVCLNRVTGEVDARLECNRKFWEEAMIAQGLFTLETRDVTDS